MPATRLNRFATHFSSFWKREREIRDCDTYRLHSFRHSLIRFDDADLCKRGIQDSLSLINVKKNDRGARRCDTNWGGRRGAGVKVHKQPPLV